MKTLVVLAALLVVACAVKISDSEIKEAWESFKTAHGKSYQSDAEEAFRLKVFKENKLKIAKHNERYDRGEVTFRVGVNRHADMLTHEIAAQLQGYVANPNRVKNSAHFEKLVSRLESSNSSTVDWRTKGYVTGVKDQGSCGACWAFSATGSIEGQLYNSTGNLTSLSEQNLLDCSWAYGNHGCDGGNIDPAFQYVIDNGGIDTEESYPYIGTNGTCNYTVDNSAGTIWSFSDVIASESALQEAVEKIGPIAVAIDSSPWTFHSYESGVYYESACSSSDLTHGVLVVGYGTENGTEYWLVKNSWGTSWGEEGYAKMARNRNNNCGIATEASYPIVTGGDDADADTSGSSQSAHQSWLAVMAALLVAKLCHE